MARPGRSPRLRKGSPLAGKPLLGRITGFASAAQRCLATARLEVKLNLGSPAPWIIGLILGALGYLTART